MVSFSQLSAVKKDTIFGAARKIFGPSYFVTALVTIIKEPKVRDAIRFSNPGGQAVIWGYK